MKRQRRSQVILNLSLACVVLFGIAPLPEPAEAGFNPLNAVTGLIRVINGINCRNRVYQAARDTKKDFDAYYGSLRATAHRQLLEGDLSSLRQGVDGPERTRASAYIRMAAAMQAEQAAVQRAVDAETNAARREFNRTLAHQLQSLLIQLPGAQRILGDVRSTISNIRRTAIAIQTAASAGQPVDNLAAELAQQLTYSAELQQAVRNLGTLADSELNRHLGGALHQVDQALADIKNQANQTVQLLDSMDAEVGQWDLSQAELGTGEGEIGPVNMLLSDRATAVLDVASQALAFLTAAQGTGGTTRQQLYQQIRADLLEGRNQRLLEAAQHVSQISCTAVGKGEYEAAAGMLGQAPQAAGDPEMARYLVCTDLETGYVIRAWIVEGGPTSTPEPGATTTPTREPQPTAPRGTAVTVAACDAMRYLEFGPIGYDNYVDTGNCQSYVYVTNGNEIAPGHYVWRYSTADRTILDHVIPPQGYAQIYVGGEASSQGGYTDYLDWLVAWLDTEPCNELFADVSMEEMSGTGLQVYTSDVTSCVWSAGTRP